MGISEKLEGMAKEKKKNQAFEFEKKFEFLWIVPLGKWNDLGKLYLSFTVLQ